MSNTGPVARNPWGSQRAVGLLLGTVVALAGCSPSEPPPETTPGSAPQSRDDLLRGYSLLADTLADESRLGTLDLFKKLTLDAPNGAISKLMKTLSDASQMRGAELEKLRRLEPDVSAEPGAKSPIGDAITAVAKDFSEAEMLSRNDGFDVRFVLVQAQATRMVAAMATATARFDPNPERRAWLTKLASEYEGYRNDLIGYLVGRAAVKRDG